MKNPKTKRIFAAALAIILVMAMVLPMILQFIS